MHQKSINKKLFFIHGQVKKKKLTTWIYKLMKNLLIIIKSINY